MKKNILLKSSLYKQISRFSVAGLSAVAVDFLSYYLLINYLSYDLSKTLSFIIGAIVAYVINKFWTFEKNNLSFKELAKFALYRLIASVRLDEDQSSLRGPLRFLDSIVKIEPADGDRRRFDSCLTQQPVEPGALIVIRLGGTGQDPLPDHLACGIEKEGRREPLHSVTLEVDGLLRQDGEGHLVPVDVFLDQFWLLGRVTEDGHQR